MPTPHGRSTVFAVSAGLTGVALGAFGAHGLQTVLATGGHLEAWRTAVEYQLLHAVVLLALALYLRRETAPVVAGRLNRAATLFATGIALFSGSIYVLALGGPRWLWPATPLGGLCLLAGWALLAHALWPRRTA